MSELLLEIVEGFGNAVGVENQGVAGGKATFPYFALPAIEQADDRTGGIQRFQCVIAAENERRKMPAIRVAQAPRDVVVFDEEERCEGSGCEQMRKAAFQLVQRKVFSDLSEDSLLKKLSGKQRDAYKEARSVAENTGDPHASEDREFVPYVLDGKVYVARIADVAFGERDLADQSIKFEQLQEGKMVERAAFSFTVVKGDLVDSSVSPASAK